MRKVGATFAGFYSADGGKTQHFIGGLAPQFDPAASLLLGLATTSNTDGTLDQATYQHFLLAPLPSTVPPAGQWVGRTVSLRPSALERWARTG